MRKNENIFKLISKIFHPLIPIIGIIGLIIPFIIGKSNLSLLGVYLAVPIILASIIHVNQFETETNLRMFDRKWFLFFISSYFIFISISIYFLYIFDIRPFIYYVIISIISGLILLEILLFDISKRNEIIILLQIMILFVDLIWGVTLKYYLFIGRTDILVHIWYIQNLIYDGHVTNLFSIYKPFPLWHILCTFIYQILGTSLSIQKIMSLTCGIIYSFIPIGTYLISTKLFKNKKISLISALFVVFNADILFYGMASIPRSVISFLEIILLLLLLSNKPEKVFLYVILTIAIVIYHTASMPFILLIILIIYIFNSLVGDKKSDTFISSNFIILSISITIIYWIYYAQTLLMTLVSNFVKPSDHLVLTQSITITPLNELFNYLQYSPLLFFLIFGFFVAMDSTKISALAKIFCMVAFILVPFSFPGPSLLFTRLGNAVQFGRFIEYSFIFITLAGAFGLYELYSKSKMYVKISIVILFMVMAFLSVSNDFNASDNPLIKRPFYTYYLTDVEENSIQHIASVTNGNVMSDYVTSRYLSYSKYANETQVIQVDTVHMELFKNQTKDIVLIRKSELSKRPLRLSSISSGHFKEGGVSENTYVYYNQDNIVWACLIKYNKVYDSKNVIGYNYGTAKK